MQIENKIYTENFVFCKQDLLYEPQSIFENIIISLLKNMNFLEKSLIGFYASKIHFEYILNLKDSMNLSLISSNLLNSINKNKEYFKNCFKFMEELLFVLNENQNQTIPKNKEYLINKLNKYSLKELKLIDNNIHHYFAMPVFYLTEYIRAVLFENKRNKNIISLKDTSNRYFYLFYCIYDSIFLKSFASYNDLHLYNLNMRKVIACINMLKNWHNFKYDDKNHLTTNNFFIILQDKEEVNVIEEIAKNCFRLNLWHKDLKYQIIDSSIDEIIKQAKPFVEILTSFNKERIIV